MTWASWLGSEFSAGEQADALVSGPDADPDGDGRSNVLEYALASSPKTNDANVGLEVFTANPIRLRHPIVNAGDITYTIERSDDLANWTEVSDLVVEETGAKRTVRLNSVDAFYRLRVAVGQ